MYRRCCNCDCSTNLSNNNMAISPEYEDCYEES